MTTTVEASESLKHVIALYRQYTKCNWEDDPCKGFEEVSMHAEPNMKKREAIIDSTDIDCSENFPKGIGWDIIQYGPIKLIGHEQHIDEIFQRKAKRKEEQKNRMDLLRESKRRSNEALAIEIYGPTAKCNRPKRSMVCEVISKICPPREWGCGDLKLRQYASCSIPTRKEVLALKEKIETKIMESPEIREDGLCFERQELITKIFDELIRQVTVACMERGQLLIHIRDEIYQQFEAYSALYNSMIATSINKVLKKQSSVSELRRNIESIELEIIELETVRSEYEPTYQYYTEKFETGRENDSANFDIECERLEAIKEELKFLLLKSVQTNGGPADQDQGQENN